MFVKVATVAAGTVMAAALLSGCASFDCRAAWPEAVSNIRDTLAAYPELGNSLSDGAQEVELDGRMWPNTLADGVVAGRLLPSGEVGLWVITKNATNGAFQGARPVNRVAILAMPEAAVQLPEAEKVMRDIEKSRAAEAALACVP